MSNIINQAEASTPLQKKMRECNPCKEAGFPNQFISFEKIGEDPNTGKNIWKPVDENGNEHKHKFVVQNNKKPMFQRKRIVDIALVTDIHEAKKLLLEGWEYKTSYPATTSNIPHFILIKRE
jgi:hypothetical protein